jgi:hypothetical protein
VTSLFSGCLGKGENQPRPRLAWISLLNDREEPYDINVVVKEDGKSVFVKTYQVGASLETANITVDDPVKEPGQYVVRAMMDGETREVDIADFVEGDENCIGVRFLLRNNASVDYWTKAMQQW